MSKMIDIDELTGKSIDIMTPSYKYKIPYVNMCGKFKKKIVNPEVYLTTSDGNTYLLKFKNKIKFSINNRPAFDKIIRRCCQTYMTKKGFRILPFQVKFITQCNKTEYKTYIGLIKKEIHKYQIQIIDTKNNIYLIDDVKHIRKLYS
jgi:hypothetical protein